MRNNKIFSNEYRGLKINANRTKGCYTDILDKIYDLLDYMTHKHSKVFFMRFDVTYPEDYYAPDKNDLFEKFIANFVKNRNRKGYDVKYVWARERNTGDHPHYHCFLFFNGNKTQSIYGHLPVIETFWARALDISEEDVVGLIEYCNRYREGIMINRNSPDYKDQINNAYEWASYLAKIKSKERVDNIRNYGTSQV